MTDIILLAITVLLALIIFELKKALIFKRKSIQMLITLYNKFKNDSK